MASSYTDLRHRRIPNLLTLPACALGLAVAYANGGVAGLLSSAFGLLVCGGVFALVALAGGMGGGDVKLMAAMGALLRFPLALHGLVYAAMLGGLLAVGMAAFRSDLGRALRNVGAWLKGLALLSKDRPALAHGAPLYVPYGLAIAAGSVWAMLSEHVSILAIL